MVGGDGHYNPRGNHVHAYALKDTLLEVLDPKPLPYRDRGPDTVDFSRYRRVDGLASADCHGMGKEPGQRRRPEDA
jgi:hypothetical protein